MECCGVRLVTKVGPVAQRFEQWTHNRGWSLSIFSDVVEKSDGWLQHPLLELVWFYLGFCWLSGTVQPQSPVAGGRLPQLSQCHLTHPPQAGELGWAAFPGTGVRHCRCNRDCRADHGED